MCWRTGSATRRKLLTRGDQFDKRRKLMEAWAAFCEPKLTGKVVPMKKVR